MLLMGAGGSPHAQHGLLDWLTSHSLLWVYAGVTILLTLCWVAVQSVKKRRPDLGGRATRQPPLLAEALLCMFARAKDIDALMGDFEEHFARDREAGMSQWRARVRYWARVLRSTGPQMWQAAKRLGLLGLIAAAMRR
jgi:hypothetical protein